MPRKQIIVFTCGECAAQGIENSAKGYEILIRDSDSGQIVVSHQWEGCIAHREGLESLIESVLAYGSRMTDFQFTPVESGARRGDRGYGGHQPSTRGTTSPRPTARQVPPRGGSTNGSPPRANRVLNPPPKPALPPPSPPSPSPPSRPAANKPLEELSTEELGHRLVANQAAPNVSFQPPSPPAPTPPPPPRTPPAPTPASTTAPEAEPEDSPRARGGNKPQHIGQAAVKNGKIVMSTVHMSCLDHPEPKPVTWLGRGTHMKDRHNGEPYWKVSWRYENLPDGWPLHECGFIVDEEKEEMCLLKFPNASGLEGHRRGTGHRPPEE